MGMFDDGAITGMRDRGIAQQQPQQNKTKPNQTKPKQFPVAPFLLSQPVLFSHLSIIIPTSPIRFRTAQFRSGLFPRLPRFTFTVAGCRSNE
jgi:hypothetical protein